MPLPCDEHRDVVNNPCKQSRSQIIVFGQCRFGGDSLLRKLVALNNDWRQLLSGCSLEIFEPVFV
jgi:hypothetical protein